MNLARVIVVVLAIMTFSVSAGEVPRRVVIIDQEPQTVLDIRNAWVEAILTGVYSVDKKQARELAPVITNAAFENEVPVEILTSLIHIESSFKPDAKSNKGAIGYAQVMPRYWDGVTPYNIRDKYENIYAGAFILRRYFEKTGSWRKAIEAYNIGITNHRNRSFLDSASLYLSRIKNSIKKLID